MGITNLFEGENPVLPFIGPTTLLLFKRHCDLLCVPNHLKCHGQIISSARSRILAHLQKLCAPFWIVQRYSMARLRHNTDSNSLARCLSLTGSLSLSSGNFHMFSLNQCSNSQTTASLEVNLLISIVCFDM